tara:strand:+ start:1366 stop:1866 length:501 start_codon:yes stop_codon:yes gene_type:complete
MMTLKEINRNIGSIKKSSHNVQDKIQATIVGCIEHAMKHGDHTQFTRLIDAMGNGVRKSDCVTYIQYVTPLNWNNKKQCFNKPRKNGRSYMLDEAKTILWCEFTKDKKIKPIDCDKIFTKTKDEVYVEYMASQDKIIQKIDKENPESFTGNYNALQERVLKALNQV